MTALAPMHKRRDWRQRPPGGCSPACPRCHTIFPSKVTDSRQSGEDIRRRRECLVCGERFTTYETVWMPPPVDFQI